MKQKRIIVTGYGTVGKEFIELLYRKKELFLKQYHTELMVTGVVGSVGMVYESEGLDLSILHQLPTGSIGISQYASMKDLVLESPAIKGDILVECTPTNIETGEPALSYIKKRSRQIWILYLSVRGACSLLARITGHCQRERMSY